MGTVGVGHPARLIDDGRDAPEKADGRKGGRRRLVGGILCGALCTGQIRMGWYNSHVEPIYDMLQTFLMERSHHWPRCGGGE